jgi:hypothetical protein
MSLGKVVSETRPNDKLLTLNSLTGGLESQTNVPVETSTRLSRNRVRGLPDSQAHTVLLKESFLVLWENSDSGVRRTALLLHWYGIADKYKSSNLVTHSCHFAKFRLQQY